MRLECGKCVVRDGDAERWFALVEAMPEPTHWAIDVDGHAVGGVGLVRKDGIRVKSASFGYWLGEAYWGRGIMTQVVGKVVPHVLSRWALVRLESPVFAWNPASMRLLEKCGFVREGVARASVFKDGEIIDQVVYARLAQ